MNLTKLESNTITSSNISRIENYIVPNENSININKTIKIDFKQDDIENNIN